MNKGLFEAHINTAWEILNALGLAEYRNYWPDYSTITMSEVRNLSYAEGWKLCYRKRVFHFQLQGCCLLQFNMKSNGQNLCLNYVYYECPYDIVSYKDFVENELRADYAHGGDLYAKEYGDYVQSCGVKESVTPIRYDLDLDSYEEGIHPASHVHIGHDNELRLGAERIWRPLSFVLFIIRQYHPEKWKKLVNMNKACLWGRNVRDKLDKAQLVFDSDLDKMQVILM
ncbi:MAG: DUF2290 domain-containing protein [Planctomycetota bacterium]|jgi:hypothetical protein